MKFLYTALLALLLPFFAAAAPTITGPSTMCVGSLDSFSATPGGGSWSTSTGSIATLISPGVVYAISSGTATLTYTVGGSGGGTTTFSFTVMAAPSVSAITGASSVCVGASITLSDATAGGTWTSSSTAVATVSSTGVVTGLTAGTTTISYSVTNACGTTTATKVITVGAPSAGTISGPGTVCVGSSITLTNATSGGTWTTSSSSIASVSPTGAVTGTSTGTAIISYSVTSSCGSATAIHTVVVSAPPSFPSISGSSTTYIGGTISLSVAVTGGTWSSTATSIATVNSTSGVVTGVAPGYALINYIVSNSCGMAFDSILIHVTSSTSVAALGMENSMNVYPSPTDGKITINWGNQLAGIATVVVSDVTGKSVFSGNMVLNGAATSNIDLTHLENGVYLISIKSGDVNFNNKIVVAH